MPTQNHLEKLRRLLDNPVLQDAPHFATTVQSTVLVFPHLTDDFLARHFGMTRSTATRWRNGTAAPHFYRRKPVYAYFQSLLESVPHEARP